MKLQGKKKQAKGGEKMEKVKVGYGTRELIVRLRADQDEILDKLMDVVEKADAVAMAARSLMDEIKEVGVQKDVEE